MSVGPGMTLSDAYLSRLMASKGFATEDGFSELLDRLVADGLLREADRDGPQFGRFGLTAYGAKLMRQHDFPMTEEGLGAFVGFLLHMRFRDHDIVLRMAHSRERKGHS